jgi:hypothetical protein
LRRSRQRILGTPIKSSEEVSTNPLRRIVRETLLWEQDGPALVSKKEAMILLAYGGAPYRVEKIKLGHV